MTKIRCSTCRGRGTVGDWTDQGGPMKCVEIECDKCEGLGRVSGEAKRAPFTVLLLLRYALGWVFTRHYIRWKRRICNISAVTQFRWALWPKKRALLKVKWRYWLVNFLTPLHAGDCDHCGEREVTEHEDLFVCTDSGGPGYEGVYWFEGIQTCPGCGHQFEYGDSN